MRTNPFDKLYATCNDSRTFGKTSRFPAYIDVELTNKCPYTCTTCPKGSGIMKREEGFMSQPIFDKIITEMSQLHIPIRFVGFGEPLLHPHIIKFLRDSKSNELLVHLCTNATFMSPELNRFITNLPIDSIKFSFQGVDKKSYKELRGFDRFDSVVSSIKYMYKLRDERDLPFIHVSTTVTNESDEEIEHFKELVGEYSDRVTVGRVITNHIDIDKTNLNRYQKLKLRELKSDGSQHRTKCTEVFNTMNIKWNGEVSACCFDFDNIMDVGNVKDQSLSTIWNSDNFKRFRKMMISGKNNEMPICKYCYDYMSIQTQCIQVYDNQVYES